MTRVNIKANGTEWCQVSVHWEAISSQILDLILNTRWDESHHLKRGRTIGVECGIGDILLVVHGAAGGALRVALSVQ
jgi:hypothetical protein